MARIYRAQSAAGEDLFVFSSQSADAPPDPFPRQFHDLTLFVAAPPLRRVCFSTRPPTQAPSFRGTLLFGWPRRRPAHRRRRMAHSLLVPQLEARSGA